MGRHKKISHLESLQEMKPIKDVDSEQVNAFIDIQQKPINHLDFPQAIVENWELNWRITTYWIYYYRTGICNIDNHPFTTPEFQAKQSLGRLYSSMLDCCIGLKDKGKISGTPIAFWESIINEKKQLEYKCLNRKSTKSDYIKSCRAFLKSLKIDRVVPKSTPELQSIFYEKCFELASKDSHFRKKYWNAHLLSLKEFIDDCAKREELKSLFIENGKPYVIVSGRQVQLLK